MDWGSFTSLPNLTGCVCGRHPNGAHKGNHAPYEGTLKSKYHCKFCRTSHSSIQNLTAGVCGKHPNGTHKVHHEPML